jgi:uncharacterized membrane protein YedE/YeeE
VALAGALIGLLFGFFAHRSRFCLRSAVIEFARGTHEGKLTVWLFTFSTAVLLTQAFILAGWLDVKDARQLSARGSLSGAAIGGAMFGAGMILARGCSSRLLVLAAQGNLRALLSGLVFAVTAQSALNGLLSPLRATIAGWWTVEARRATCWPSPGSATRAGWCSAPSGWWPRCSGPGGSGCASGAGSAPSVWA